MWRGLPFVWKGKLVHSKGFFNEASISMDKHRLIQKGVQETESSINWSLLVKERKTSVQDTETVWDQKDWNEVYEVKNWTRHDEYFPSQRFQKSSQFCWQ